MKNRQDFDIPGLGSKNSSLCNTVVSAQYCSDCNTYSPRFHHCYNWDCPECYFWTASRAAHRLEERLIGVQKAYSSLGKFPGKVIHLVLSPPKSDYSNFSLLNSRKKSINYAKQIGVLGAAVVFHPYRVHEHLRGKLLRSLKDSGEKGGIWRAIIENRLNLPSWKDAVYFSPHFHVLGFYPRIKVQSTAFFKATGWMYKAIDVKKARNVYQTARYLLTHHALLPGHNIIYMGIASYAKTSVTVKKETILKPCPCCNSDNYFVVECGDYRYSQFIEGIEKPSPDELFIHVRLRKKVKWFFVRTSQLTVEQCSLELPQILTVG